MLIINCKEVTEKEIEKILEKDELDDLTERELRIVLKAVECYLSEMLCRTDFFKITELEKDNVIF